MMADLPLVGQFESKAPVENTVAELEEIIDESVSSASRGDLSAQSSFIHEPLDQLDRMDGFGDDLELIP